jgi:hypothetical protein
MTAPRSPRTSNASPRTQRKRPGDMTGVNSQKLAAERDKDKSEAIKEEVEAAAAEKEAKRHTTVDYSTPDPVAQVATDIEVEDDVEVEPVAVPESKDTYTKDELQEAIAQAVAAAVAGLRPGKQTVGLDEVEVAGEVEVGVKKEYIRVNYPIDDMTYGREVIDEGYFDHSQGVYKRPPRLGNLRVLNFEEGVRYLVDKDIADHLRSLGYVYEF